MSKWVSALGVVVMKIDQNFEPNSVHSWDSYYFLLPRTKHTLMVMTEAVEDVDELHPLILAE